MAGVMPDGKCAGICALFLTLVFLTLCTGPARAYWLGEERLTNEPSPSHTSPNNAWCVAFDAAGKINVVWTDYRDGHAGVYHKSFDGSAWSPDTLISLPAAAAHDPSVTADDAGSIHVVWTDYRDLNSEIYYRAFDGTVWGTPERISSNSSNSFNPSVSAGDSGKVYVVWQDNRNYNWEVYYRSFDGAAWSGEQRLTDDPSTSVCPSVAAGPGGTVHVTWQDRRDANYEIYYKCFDGAWSSDQRLTTDSSSSDLPSIAVDADGDAHVVWLDFRDGALEIYHKVRVSGVWSEDERLTYVSEDSIYPSIAADASGGVHVVWLDERDDNDNIYYKRHDGLGWGVDERLTSDAATAAKASIAVGPDSTMAVVWSDDRDGNSEIYAQRYQEGPVPPPVLTSISPNQGSEGSRDLHIALSGENFFMVASVWLSMPGEPDVVATDVVVESSNSITCVLDLYGVVDGHWDVVVRNPDGQLDTLEGGFQVLPNIWGPDVRLTREGTESSLSYPSGRCIVTDSSGDVHVVWTDSRAGNREIYYKKFDGAYWSLDQRLTYADNGSAYPAMAVDESDNLHLVWHDYRDGDYEIYYKRFNGLSWGADERLTDADGDSKYPSVTAHGDNRVFVVWQDERPVSGKQYLYLREHDGLAWHPEILHSECGAGFTTPSVCLDSSNNVHIVWWRNYGDDQQICHIKYADGIWGASTVIADSYDASGPTVSRGANGQVHAAWNRSPGGGWGIYHCLFDVDHWGAPETITSGPTLSSHPSIVVDADGDVHMVWCDRRDGNKEIYYTRRESGLWGGQVRLTAVALESDYPFLSLGSDGAIHVIWRDYRDANFEIYYKERAPDAIAGAGDQQVGGKRLGQLRVAPNPLRVSTHIEFTLPGSTEPRISIFDTAGRLVRRIEPGVMDPGPRRISWDGRGSTGDRVASGIYFIEVATPEHKASTKMIVLR
ncbi:FlgD immunoglobulin-like domain containing protein [Candidatus Eisenbacteria bacterium]|uniref:FlgD immunoglobulin-like domain containing protein n=1 Tax=Eiseniibacteriota bacterium TaxID=2212470 RepID=A0ABV6YP11_UNCEI